MVSCPVAQPSSAARLFEFFLSVKMRVDFKDEKEVKEYIENLGIEYRFGCFSEKNPEVCHLLGDYLEAIKKDYHKAARIYKTNCDDYNYPKSCHSYGNYVIQGKGQEKKDEDVAYKYYLKGCELNVPTSCYNAAALSISTTPKSTREKDYTKGVQLLDKGCTLGHGNACFLLAGLYITGTKDNAVQKDMKQAFTYTNKACELGHIYACMNLSAMYRKGDGVEKSEEMANKYKEKVKEMKEEIESSLTVEFQRGTES